MFTHLFNQYINEHKQKKLMIIQLQFDIILKNVINVLSQGLTLANFTKL